MLQPTDRIVVLTGAGISAESGLATFRGADGLWEGHRPEEVATPEAFNLDPRLVHRFYNQRRRQLLDPAIVPNAAHLALVRLENAWPGGVVIVTQNVDNLHERAGSHGVIHMHGELMRVRCGRCHFDEEWDVDVDVDTACPACGRSGGLRPAIVWFGEIPLHLDRIGEALENCGFFAAIGTSGVVYPAAGFVAEVRRFGRAHTLELNTERSAIGSLFHDHRQGPAGVEVPKLVDELLAQLD